MACHTPIEAHYNKDNEVIIGPPKNRLPLKQLFLPCGKCVGCRNDYTKDWAVRCYHESKMHDFSCVLTLTFDENTIDPNLSLQKSDIVNFIKKLRIKLARNYNNKKISYLYCGEYGSKFNRPHYHCIIFGYDFPDKKYLKDSKTGDPMYQSKELSELWEYGFSTIGSMSMASAMYCASYITKYVSNSEKDDLYTNKITGELRQVEFGNASKNPAIGLQWFKKYHNDILAHNCIIIDNQKYRIPRYYIKKLKELYPEKYEYFESERKKAIDNKDINWHDLKNKHTIAYSLIKNKGRLKSDDNYKRLVYLQEITKKTKEF